MPHCEASGLLEFYNLPGIMEAISRDHIVVLYGDRQRNFEILARALGWETKIFKKKAVEIK